MKYVLAKPIVYAEETVTSLTFREEVVAGDLRGLKIGAELCYDDVLKIAGRLCARPDPFMAMISFADMIEVTKLVASFMNPGAGPELGKTA